MNVTFLSETKYAGSDHKHEHTQGINDGFGNGCVDERQIEEI